MRRHGLCLVVCCLCMLIARYVTADEHIVRDVLGSGGGAAVSADYRLLHTVGQPVINLVTDPGHIHDQGFWYLPWFFITAVDEENPTPRANRLFQNYPNPFNPVTTFRFALEKPSWATLEIYDALGRLVKTLVDEEMDEGEYTITFNARGLASGVYFYRMRAAEFEKTRKMVILR